MKKELFSLGTGSVIAGVLAVCLMFTGCGSKDSTKKKQQVKNTSAETAVTESETDVKLPEGIFCEMPDEALDDFDYMSETLKKLFPDTKGKLMYGFKGEKHIYTLDGDKNCYVFDYYSYRKKNYEKIASVAKDMDSDTIYLFDEITGRYNEAEPETEKSELQWHETATAALAIDTTETDELTAE